MNDAFVYDQVPYSSFTFPQTRPDRLATLGALHGLNPASPETCRVLELGCGDGTSLISFAYILPDSEFVGIDLSSLHINQGKTTAKKLNISNLTFLQDDVMNLSRERFGEFDFIVAHGLFSWVPDFLRAKILEIYSECLAPEGIGYISYNAYPGCHIRSMFWKMMQFYTATVRDPMAKVHHGINFMRFLAAATPKGGLYQSLIQMELEQFGERTPENIYHDDFAELNQPFYFHEFVELIQEKGLQFLSEVDSFWMEADQISPEIKRKLDDLGDDIVQREQYIDFIKCRPFRSTLVCHHRHVLDRNPTAQLLKNFYIASQVQPESTEDKLWDSSLMTFIGPEGGKFEVDHPLTKAALVCLENAWSSCLTFDELINEARQLVTDTNNVDVAIAADKLMELFHSGFVYLHRFRPKFVKEPGQFPRSSEFVRWQLRHKAKDITALSGMNLTPDSDLMRLILLLADGSRDRAALLSEAAARIEMNEGEKTELMDQLALTIEFKLKEFAKLGLLLA